MNRHGTYERGVFTDFCDMVWIAVLRYRCPVCGQTVSFLPSFCVPRKRYSSALISWTLYLILVCKESLRSWSSRYRDKKAYGDDLYSANADLMSEKVRIISGIWLKQWSFGATGVVSELRSNFKVKPRNIKVASGHYSKFITKVALRAFHACGELVLDRELVVCKCNFTLRTVRYCPSNTTCMSVLPSVLEIFSKHLPGFMIF